MLTEVDLELIHALQLRPRAAWAELGRTLNVDAVTAARRFGRLADRGEAWVGVSPGPRLFEQLCVAFVEIDCTAGAAAAVSAALGSHPHAVTIERSADTHRILATVATVFGVRRTRDLPGRLTGRPALLLVDAVDRAPEATVAACAGCRRRCRRCG